MHLQHALQFTHNDAFLSANDIVTGDKYRPIIFKEIANCDIFVLIGTYIALDHPWVEDEVSEAQRLGKDFAICINHKVENGFRETRVGKRVRGYRYERIYDYDGGGGSQVVRFVTEKLVKYIESHKSPPQQDSYKKSLEQVISTGPRKGFRDRGTPPRLTLEQVIEDAINAAKDSPGSQDTGLTEASTSNETEASPAQQYIDSYEYDEYLKNAERYENSQSTQRLKLSLQQIEGAIEIDPQKSIGWTKKGKVLEKLGRWDEARESFDKAKELFRKYGN